MRFNDHVAGSNNLIYCNDSASIELVFLEVPAQTWGWFEFKLDLKFWCNCGLFEVCELIKWTFRASCLILTFLLKKQLKLICPDLSQWVQCFVLEWLLIWYFWIYNLDSCSCSPTRAIEMTSSKFAGFWELIIKFKSLFSRDINTFIARFLKDLHTLFWIGGLNFHLMNLVIWCSNFLSYSRKT